MNSDRVKRWEERGEYDFETAEAMHAAGRYIYSVFMCQQAIEKCFKALLAYNRAEILPIHNLRRLAELSGIVGELDEDKLRKLDFLSWYYINARYKEDIVDLSKGITEELSENFIDFTKETIQWLLQKIK